MSDSPVGKLTFEPVGELTFEDEATTDDQPVGELTLEPVGGLTFEDEEGSTPADEDYKNMSAYDIRETPKWGGDAWTPTEITKVAKKHGVSEDWVKKEINWAQGETQEQADAEFSLDTLKKDGPGALRVLGGTLDKALGRIPSSIFGEDYTEAEKKAIDDIREISSKKLSLLSDLANFRGMFSAGSTLAKGFHGLGKLTLSANVMKKLEHPIGMAMLGSAEGAIYGASEAKYDKGLEDALYGAAAGGILGGAVGVVFSKFSKKADLEDLKPKDFTEAANNLGISYSDELAHVTKTKGDLVRGVKNYVASEDVAKSVDDTIVKLGNLHDRLRAAGKEELINKKQLTELRQIRGYGKYFVSKGKRGQLTVEDELLARLTEKSLAKKMPDPSVVKSEKNWRLSLMDNLQAGKILDGKYGTYAERTFQKIGEAINHSKNITRKNLEMISKRMPSVLSEINAEQALGKESLTKMEAVTKKLFTDIKDSVEKEFKVKLPVNANFIVPRMTKSHQSWLVSLDDHLRETFDVTVKKDSKGKWKLDAEDRTKLTEALANDDKDAVALINHLNEVTGTKTKNFDSIEAAFDHVRVPGKEDDFNVARLMKRDDEAIHIPTWALETDVETLAYRYARDLAKGVATAPSLVALNSFRKIAKNAGDGGTAGWYEDLINDIKGAPRTREGLQNFSLSNSYSSFMEKKAANAMIEFSRGDKGLKNQSIALLPQVANLMTRVIYPNLLSKPISFMKNVTSPYFSTIPYLRSSGVGRRESMAISMNAFFDTIRQLDGMRGLGKDGKPNAGFWKSLKEGEKEILEKGLTHSQFTGEMAEKLADESIRNLKKDTKLGKLFAKAEGAERVYANTFLYFFQASETIARVNSMNMAKRLSERMAQHSNFAKNVVNSVDSPAFKSKWRGRALPKQGTPEYKEFEGDMISLVNANTMFNYDRANMSGYGRAMGPLFSQFSKWPLMMVGKVQAPFFLESNKDASWRIAQTLMLPTAMMMGVDQVAKGLGFYDEPTYKTWVGSLQSYTPGDALLGAFKEDATSTPATQFIFGIPQTLANPRQAIPEHLKNSWDYFGLGGAEKALGAAYSTFTNEKANLPSRQAYHSLRNALKEKKEK